MADTATATPTQGDAKSTAANIVKGIETRANGKAPTKQDQSTDPKSQTPETPVDPNAGKKKYVVNSKEIWLTPEQADAYVQKGIAFEPKVDQLNRLQKETTEFLNELKSNPAKILFNKQFGLTPEAVFENVMASAEISDAIKEKVGRWYYQNVIEPAKLTPEQLKAREDAKWREARERHDAAARDQMAKMQEQQKIEAAMNQIKLQIAEAMQESGLPDNNTPLGIEIARMIADTMRIAHFNKQAITPKQAIEFVKKRIKAVQTAYYDSLDEDKLVQELGEANAEKIKKYYLKLAKASEKEIPKGQKQMPRRSNDRKVMGLDDFHDYLDELKKKG